MEQQQNNNSLTNANIICLSTSDWHAPYGSKQQIMSILARQNRILYVEAQISILHILKNPLKGVIRIKRWIKGVSGNGKLYLYTPMPLFPFANYFLLINRLNQLILLYSLKRLIKRLGFESPILWVYCINSALLVGKIKEKISIYYCIDDFSSEKACRKRNRVLCNLEDYILKKADIVFACTKSLYEDRRKRRPDIHFIRNGVDFQAFHKKYILKEIPDDILNIKSPRIGYVGTLDSRIDCDLILSLASENNDWQIVLIGNNIMPSRERAALRNFSNIHNLGFKHPELIPIYINMLDVCIMPYRITDFNEHIFPLKTLEYLAAGKPIVSTYLPDLDEFSNIIKLCRNRAEFINYVNYYIGNDNGISIRKEIAAKFSWESRTEEITQIILQRLCPEDYRVQ
ncbi:MAG: glycosyltransferase [Candidatus Omnitrophica bacterium]|nr:glycosyltransferase [Candidatus Omnitrophota bacterium]MDD5237761.1 glycosyltransferase [Candidatus Omnitrophota bacterium]